MYPEWSVGRGVVFAATVSAIAGMSFPVLAQDPDKTEGVAADVVVQAAGSDPHAGHVAEKVLSFGIDEIVVTASPLDRTAAEVSQPVSVLDGTELIHKWQPTLGETLKDLPGVTATYYGPGASRPVIRGLGGDRVRMLDGGLVSLDASAASDDHAVTINPMALERVEVLRGPAALRYGPNAAGGAVNAIDGRVPRQLHDAPVSGRVQLRGGSVDGSFGGAAVLNGSIGQVSYHLDGYGLTAGDTDIPGFARSKRLRKIDPLPPDEEAKNTLPNSAVETTGFATGVSWVDDRFFVGLAPSLYRTDYGTVAEDDVTIDLEQKRLDFAAAVYQPSPYLSFIDGRLRLVDYDHTELEGKEEATRFDNEGYDLRLEAVHERIGRFDGAFGFQSLRSDFSAEGVEAFLPNTLTSAQSGFFLEEIDWEPVIGQVGGRVDYTTVDSDGGDGFGPPRDRAFLTGSTALGLIYDVNHEQSVTLHSAYTQRPPNYEELYANGPHIALNRFEIGDPDFGVEHSLGLNLAYLKTEGRFVWSLNGFYTRFWDFITLLPTGEVEDDLPVEVFVNVPAQFAGGEAEIAYHVLDQTTKLLHFIARIDYVWAEDPDMGEALPRIPPLRFGGSIVGQYHGLGSQLDLLRVQAQGRVPDEALKTDGYTMLDVSFTYSFDSFGPFTPMLFFRMSNLLDEEARDAVSFLKDIAPLPGRNFSGGARVLF